MLRELQEQDYNWIMSGILSWWSSEILATDPKIYPDLELINRLVKALITESEEVNVSRTIGKTGINRFYVRHNVVPCTDERWISGDPWINVFDRNGHFLTDYTKSLTKHLYQALKNG